MIIQAIPYPTAAAGGRAGTDPYWSNVVLLAGFDGGYVDESSHAHALTNVGASLDTAQKKFGSSSLRVNGSYVSIADSDDFTYTGDFTIECFVCFSALTGMGIVAQYDAGASGSNRGVELAWTGTQLRVIFYTTGYQIIGGNWLPGTGIWHHVAVDRSGSTVRVYADGTVIATSAASGGPNVNSTLPLLIGRATNDYQGGNGWIDEVRITKGVARYAGAFTPPTTMFPGS